MTLGPDRRTTARDLLADYLATGRVPRISGGDHDGEGDGNESNEGESQNHDQNDNANSGGEQGERSGGDGFKAITSQAELDNLIGKRLDRERKKIAQTVREEIEAEARRKEAEENGNYKTLHETATQRIEELEGEIAQRDRDELRARIARKHSLPEDAAKYLTGDDEDAIEASAKDLAKLTARREDIDTDSGKPNAGGGGGKKKESLLASYTFGPRR